MLLAGDIGGTKALLALAESGEVRFERRYACCDFAIAPWQVIAANHKWYARTEVLRRVVRALRD